MAATCLLMSDTSWDMREWLVERWKGYRIQPFPVPSRPIRVTSASRKPRLFVVERETKQQSVYLTAISPQPGKMASAVFQRERTVLNGILDQKPFGNAPGSGSGCLRVDVAPLVPNDSSQQRSLKDLQAFDRAERNATPTWINQRPDASNVIVSERTKEHRIGEGLRFVSAFLVLRRLNIADIQLDQKPLGNAPGIDH
ncbi:hypothetical protein B0H17DRAFT_1126856 [Mycena rosella]|uniref:Uncharacterized protein n=1 Tax=Mycena rosella TaxID=1033263 RepID=A0AAD7M7J9_MYCRO|nr:hypothetical protein B0H17DRAFT_1126856 [Mycena rosella]